MVSLYNHSHSFSSVPLYKFTHQRKIFMYDFSFYINILKAWLLYIFLNEVIFINLLKKSKTASIVLRPRLVAF